MNKKNVREPQKETGIKISGRRKDLVRVSFSSVMPVDYAPYKRDMLKQFESDIMDFYEKKNTEK